MTNTYKHKETFFQDYSQEDCNIPSHWVVQYYINDGVFPESKCFSEKWMAEIFELELKNNYVNNKNLD